MMKRLKYLTLAGALCILSGCSAVKAIRRSSIPPVATVAVGSTVVEQKGEALTPASGKAEEKKQEIILPAGTWVFPNWKTGEFEYRLSKDTPITTTVRKEEAVGPAAFTPPTPPTISEEMNAKADFWTTLGYRIGVAVGIAAALFGLVRAWTLVMWGGVAMAGACLFGLFVKNHPVLLAVIGVGVALTIVGPIIWHWKLKPMEEKK